VPLEPYKQVIPPPPPAFEATGSGQVDVGGWQSARGQKPLSLPRGRAEHMGESDHIDVFWWPRSSGHISLTHRRPACNKRGLAQPFHDCPPQRAQPAHARAPCPASAIAASRHMLQGASPWRSPAPHVPEPAAGPLRRAGTQAASARLLWRLAESRCLCASSFSHEWYEVRAQGHTGERRTRDGRITAFGRNFR